MLDVFVLGALRASMGGRDLSLGGAKQRALLARLVVARGRPVLLEQLINDIWEEAPPRDPVHALQARVSRLRSALSAEIEFVADGYRLDPASVQTDSALFEKLCEHGSGLLIDGNLAQAAECLNRALELWHGPAFAGLPDIQALRTESVRLDTLRATALADRIDLDLALGHSDAVISELHALVEKNPIFERHWGQLMVALYSSGRAVEALEAFAQARALFADRLGVEPSGELGQLHLGILQEQPPDELLRLPVPTQVLDAAADAEASSNDSRGRVVTSNQPDALVALLRSHRTLLLTGPAGIGKSHLMRAVSARFEAQHCSAPLLTATPLSQAVPLGVFAGVGGSLPQEWTSPAALVDHFARQRSMAVSLVDNVDQLDEASLFVVTQLIRAAQVPTILTSRDLTSAPQEIRSLYDSGELIEVAVDGLSDAAADGLVTQLVGGPLTPDARPQIFAAASGNPLYLREIIAASLDEDRLVRTEHGWELAGAPASTPRLTQVVGERFSGLDDAGLEAAARVAIAGEYPSDALGADDRRALSRAGVVEYSVNGRLRLSQPLDKDFLHARCSPALWRDLSHEVLHVLLSDATADWSAGRRRGHILALELDQPIDVEATLAVAEHALGAFDERLAFRAAEAVVNRAPSSVNAHRIAGLAASSLGMPEVAVAHFEAARGNCATAAEQAAVALAHARHLGLQHHDAAGALAVVQAALGTVDDPDVAEHLQRDAMRWAVIAGQAGQVGEAVDAPKETTDAAAALGLITVGMSGAITGPLDDAERALARLHRIPEEIMELVPGGAALVNLTEVMVLSNTGDVLASRRRLQQMITEAQARAPESLGIWEYALGFSELFSGDAERAYELALLASAHLEWRDITGLLPAARALTGAAAHATGRAAAADKEFDEIPRAAAGDPKVVMLRAWADAWRDNDDGRTDLAARTLLDTTRWLINAQHTYFAGMLAHCAVRIGVDLTEAAALLEEVKLVAGGGLLELFTRHAIATIAGDGAALDAIAGDAQELGIVTTAADTWLSLAQMAGSSRAARLDVSQHRRSADRLRAELPTMALWAQSVGNSFV